ncbi:epoxide hydrolase N-terminal domain-containing protein [Rhodococcus sp. JS3073]|uniref:epoxide hydrolase N-terminal domain-containing protein n=1 Tax=Rhodococcus sp. JS3073 TaxID=3002901 RepID=UPI0022865870|nr:epoxide hydrolase N-terminal domain-containing protein [Rhodococcus sp. JS3073]WAM12420.1 epoxide hydrolase N-terminal domain-containing protein [Rhodococcus sp. JS3073]
MTIPHAFPLEPTPIHVSDEVLDDLRARLTLTRPPLDEGNGDWFYGVPDGYLRELVAYWRDGYDWREAEAAINAYEHYQVSVAGVPVHFMRKPGLGPRPIPLILTHGWPWTFWHWSKVIDPLADPAAFGGDPADAFDVIVPSLPGFGFRRRAHRLFGRQLLEGLRPLAHPDDRDPRIREVRCRGLRHRRDRLQPARPQVRRRTVWHPHRLRAAARLLHRPTRLGLRP